MNPSAVLVKTERGLDEIRARSAGLSQRVRTILIMIDGKTTARELLGRLTAFPEADRVLDALVREGFAAVVPQAAPERPAAAAFSPSLSPEADVRQAVNDLCRYLHDELGPEADMITVKIESASNRADFAQGVRRGISMLAAVVGQGKANQFQARAQVILDTYFGA
jgi:hypothetical protein